jgi:hypothetical protein
MYMCYAFSASFCIKENELYVQLVRRMDLAMDQAFSSQPVTAEGWVQSQASPGGICGGQSCTMTVFSSSSFILAVLSTHTFIYHRSYVI